VKLSKLPAWFLEREDALEVVGMMVRADSSLMDGELEKIFESVFVVAGKFQIETVENSKTNTDRIEGCNCGEDAVTLHGFDTGKELIKYLQDEEDEEVLFIYHTRKKCELEWNYEVRVWPKGGSCEPEAGSASKPPATSEPKTA
jgi:hypothetical protein